MTKVYVFGIHWTDEEDRELGREEAAALGLPEEDCVELDEREGDWSEAGLEDQCRSALELKYAGTGVRPGLLWAEAAAGL